MIQHIRSERNLWAWTVLLATALVGLDSMTPLVFNVGVVYTTVVLLSLWSNRQSFTYFAASAATCLVVVGLFVSPKANVVFWAAATDRLLSVVVIWITTVLCIIRQQMTLRDARVRLESERALKENKDLKIAKATLEHKTQELIATKDVAVYMAAKVAESRDMETGQHLERIRAYGQILSHELRKNHAYAEVIDDEFQANLYRSSPLHDIGKVGIRDEILLKPGRLTVDEFEMMKRHTVIGSNIIEEAINRHQNAKFLEMAALIVRCHHERFDGSGYPAGLSGAAIPLAARIVSLADVFDALTTERPYKKAYSPRAAKKIIENESGRHFDPAIVDAFQNRFDDFVKVQLRYPNKHVQILGITESLLAEVCG